jgi:pyruvate/2-oxoglutarate dehydrogenase complex dihydrolipoamide dehydrogenase (E3) component
VTTGEDAGYFKLIFDQDSQRLVGAQMVSPAAEELIQLCALAIRARVPASLVETQLSVHPSRTDHLIRTFAPEPGAVPRPVAYAGVVESRP